MDEKVEKWNASETQHMLLGVAVWFSVDIACHIVQVRSGNRRREHWLYENIHRRHTHSSRVGIWATMNLDPYYPCCRHTM